MKNLLFLLTIILFSCEKQEIIPDPPKCKICVTFTYYSDGKIQKDEDFYCDPNAIAKRERLNFSTLEGGQKVIYSTICFTPDCKGK